MVTVNPNPSQGFLSFDSMNLNHLHRVDSPPPFTAMEKPNYSFSEDTNINNSKKIRKPYTITKSRESWTEQEHDKFLEALQLFDRDWKKMEAFVGTKTVSQIRGHAQKYFLKIQKSGKSEHVPPPRPKKKASHPYPQKAPKRVTSQNLGLYQPSSSTFEPRNVDIPDSSVAVGHPDSNATFSSWSCSSVPAIVMAQVPTVMPDFAQVYSFIGGVFDLSVSGHLHRLRQMDPVNLETALLLMQNLATNLMSPEFENHRRLISSYDEGLKKARFGSFCNNICGVR